MASLCAICSDDSAVVAACPACQGVLCSSCFESEVQTSAAPDRIQCRLIIEAERKLCGHTFAYDFLVENVSASFLARVHEPRLGAYLARSEEPFLEISLAQARTEQEVQECRARHHEIEKKLQTLRAEAANNKRTQDAAQARLRAFRSQILIAGENGVRHCAAVNCPGVLLDRWSGICSLCEASACASCGHAVARGTPHTCLDADRWSVDAIVQTCKRCPRCRVFVQKLSGCDEMFCISCHAYFRFSTGELLPRATHNPEAARLQEELAEQELRPTFNAVSHLDAPFRANLCRLVNHVELVTRRKYVVPHWYDVNSALRLSFARGNMSRAEFEARLRKAWMRRSYFASVFQVLLAFCTTVRHGIYDVFQLREQTNAQLARIARAHQIRSAPHRIRADFGSVENEIRTNWRIFPWLKSF